jgi:putative transposase
MMCNALDVSRSGYYAWSKRPPSSRSQEDQQLCEKIQEIHQNSRQSYGSPRIHHSLLAAGFKIGRQRVIRLMGDLGISARTKRRFVKTTDSEHSLPVAENVLSRNFTTGEPDQAWVADITYIPTAEGWLYLAVILDLFSRRVIGWSMDNNMRTELVANALNSALGQRIPSIDGLVFHSDRGSQYASHDYRNKLKASGITCSMSRRGNCWDNAVAESFFGTIKTELIHRQNFSSQLEARTVIAEWIEVFYNRKRIHSSTGYLTPVEFENRYWRNTNKVEPVIA